MKQLDEIRKQINEYDDEIMELLSKRMEAVNEVAQIKKENQLPIFDKKREEDIIRAIKEKDFYGANEISSIYAEMMAVSRNYQAKKLLPARIFLIGYMGAGKTTVGKIISDITGFSYFDMDKLIEETEDRKIKDIFAQMGEPYFRAAESRILKELTSVEYAVISCGGGVILDENNRKLLKEKGISVFLKGDPKILFDRVKEDINRPLAAGRKEAEEEERRMSFIERYENRMPYYEASAAIVIDIDQKEPQEIVEEIICRLI